MPGVAVAPFRSHGRTGRYRIGLPVTAGLVEDWTDSAAGSAIWSCPTPSRSYEIGEDYIAGVERDDVRVEYVRVYAREKPRP